VASYLQGAENYKESPLKPPATLNGHERPAGFDQWYSTNASRQKQPGYTVPPSLPLET
jgi:hypothetical protein